MSVEDHRKSIVLRLAAAFLLIGLCRGAAAREQIMVPVDYHDRQIQLSGWFDKPGGAGPFPVVIVLHNCAGYDQNMFYGSLPGWVSLLQQQGYATFSFDSFTARGYSEVCGTNAVTAAERAADTLIVATLLAARPDVDRGHIAAIGFSHGGGTAVYVARDRDELRPLRARLAAQGGRFVASIGVYPGCRAGGDSRVIVPLLLLAGEKDDWTPATACTALAISQPGAPITVKVYPGAYHAFDVPRGFRSGYGHMLAYDANATADARARVAEFLSRYLH
jgi:dienelactone hydrolase